MTKTQPYQVEENKRHGYNQLHSILTQPALGGLLVCKKVL
jgi:hypothetical protein